MGIANPGFSEAKYKTHSFDKFGGDMPKYIII